MIRGARPATVDPTYLAMTGRPSLTALDRFIRTTAAAPSVTWLALPPVVTELAEEQRGIVLLTGTTGSGKSTLALALLATMRPDKGTIHVGSVDISRVNVHTWRHRISFVAQDPVLFPGTLRKNLDPLDEYSDAECESVLDRVLGGAWRPDSLVDGGGRNLSQGQRQLVGIGRAMLRRSPVVILDEATASIDRATAENIQAILRQELRYSTVITVAHRIEAVRDADYFVRLDEGGVEECGPVTGALMPNTNTNSTSTNTPAASAATTTTTTSTSDDDAAAGAAT